MDVAHGLQPIHARHEDIQAQEIEIAGFELGKSLAAVGGDVNTMASPFQQEPNCQLNGWVIVHYQNLGHENLSNEAESKTTASCKGLLNSWIAASGTGGGFCTFWPGTAGFSMTVTELNQNHRATAPAPAFVHKPSWNFVVFVHAVVVRGPKLMPD
jgi:hypothetical protein